MQAAVQASAREPGATVDAVPWTAARKRANALTDAHCCSRVPAARQAMSAFGGSRGVAARPPEKGIFPLDHFGECKQVRRWGGEVQGGAQDQPRPCSGLAARRPARAGAKRIAPHRAACCVAAPATHAPPLPLRLPSCAAGPGLPGLPQAAQRRRLGLPRAVAQVPGVPHGAVSEAVARAAVAGALLCLRAQPAPLCCISSQSHTPLHVPIPPSSLRLQGPHG